MPQGIILASSSHGATQEAIEEVLTKHGYEPDKPETTPAEPVEPKREDFKTDAEFEAAQTEFDAKQEEAENAAAEEEEKKAEAEQRRQEERHPKLTRRQRAIDKATRELQEKNRKLEERLLALEGKGTKTQPEPAAKIEAPKREDFKTDAEFEEAQFDYRYKVRRAREAAQEAQNAEQNRLKENLTDYQDAVADMKEQKDFEDWDDVVNQSTPISEAVYFSILELRKDGARVTYYLATHPEELDRLNALSHHSAAMEVARLSDKLKTGAPNRGEAGSKAPVKPRPRIPEPVQPVSGAATASTLTSLDAAKKRDFKAFKAAQRAGR